MRFARIPLLALGLCRRNAASFALRIVGNDVYRVETPVPAWNVDGSAEHKPKKHSSWIKCHKEMTKSSPSICSYQGCTCASSLVGGHIMTPEQGPFIAPICRKCNYYKNSSRFQHANGRNSLLRSGTLLYRVPYTDDMKGATRRIRQ